MVVVSRGKMDEADVTHGTDRRRRERHRVDDVARIDHAACGGQRRLRCGRHDDRIAAMLRHPAARAGRSTENGSSASSNAALLHRDELRDDRATVVQDLLALAIHVHAVDRRLSITVQTCVTRVGVDQSVDWTIREDGQNGMRAGQAHHLDVAYRCRLSRAPIGSLPTPPESADGIQPHRVSGRKKKKPRKSENLRGFVTAFGGDGGIRTLDPGFGPDAPLAGECLRPLGHVSQTFARTREAVRRERNNIGFRTVRQFP